MEIHEEELVEVPLVSLHQVLDAISLVDFLLVLLLRLEEASKLRILVNQIAELLVVVQSDDSRFVTNVYSRKKNACTYSVAVALEFFPSSQCLLPSECIE